MDYIQINKLSKKALYLQIADSIKSAILTGRLRHHDLLPPEDDVCMRFGVSNIVIKHAYQNLVKQGLIHRVRGKGTFVSSIKKIHLRGSKDFSLEEVWENTQIKMNIILKEKVLSSPKEMVYLNLESPIELYHIVWVGLKQDYPIVLQESYYPLTFDAKLLHLDTFNALELYVHWLNEVHNDTRVTTHEFCVEAIDEINAKVLELPKQSASHVVYSVMQYNHSPHAFFKTIFPGEHFQIDFGSGQSL